MIGFLGIALLIAPTLHDGVSADIFSVIALLLAGLSWGIGSVFNTRKPVALTSVVNSGYQQLIGAIGFGIIVFLIGETWAQPNVDAWLAWGYLVIFGSLFAFTAFIRALIAGLASPKAYRRMEIVFDPCQDPCPIRTGRERLGDIVYSLLEAIIGAGITQIKIKTSQFNKRVLVTIAGHKPIPANAFNPRRLGLYNQMLSPTGGVLGLEGSYLNTRIVMQFPINE